MTSMRIHWDKIENIYNMFKSAQFTPSRPSFFEKRESGNCERSVHWSDGMRRLRICFNWKCNEGTLMWNLWRIMSISSYENSHFTFQESILSWPLVRIRSTQGDGKTWNNLTHCVIVKASMNFLFNSIPFSLVDFDLKICHLMCAFTGWSVMNVLGEKMQINDDCIKYDFVTIQKRGFDQLQWAICYEVLRNDDLLVWNIC